MLRIPTGVEIGGRITLVLQLAGLKGKEMADVLGLGQSTISRLQGGRAISPQRVIGIANAVAGKGWLEDEPEKIRDFLECQLDQPPVRAEGPSGRFPHSEPLAA